MLGISPYTFSRMRFRQFTVSAALDTIKELGCKSLRLGAWEVGRRWTQLFQRLDWHRTRLLAPFFVSQLSPGSSALPSACFPCLLSAKALSLTGCPRSSQFLCLFLAPCVWFNCLPTDGGCSRAAVLARTGSCKVK